MAKSKSPPFKNMYTKTLQLNHFNAKQCREFEAKAKFCVNIRTQIRTLLVQQNSQWVELASEGAFLSKKES